MNKIGNSWDKILKTEFQKPYLQNLFKWLDLAYKEKKILPPKKDIFKALRLTPFEEVKVIILGQDPYPGTDPENIYHAHGLAFSSQSTCQIPASLKNIYKELGNDLEIFISPKADLTPWAMQGILLLNTVLTVEAGKSNSHRNLGWEKLTDFIIEKLGKDPRPMVFLLWGNPSHKKEKLILNDNKFIIKTAHPSPLSAYRGFYGSKPFSKTNNFLEKNNLSPIIWA